MAPLLEVRALSVKYANVEALHGIDLAVDQGEIVTILGANGAGKSTTLRAISGLVRASGGEIRFDGKPVHVVPAHRRVAMGISQSPEGRRIFGTLTVRENLDLGAFTRGDQAKIDETRRWVYRLFPVLEERRTQLAGTLSGGEQQMLAIGRALMASPRVLLLDEPSLGLSPLFVSNIFEIIKQINRQGTTILLVEQNVYQSLRLSHRAYVLETGRVVLTGTGPELLANAHVKKAFLGM
jgi:branched-chain amino acid transport system ATP-binding protein